MKSSNFHSIIRQLAKSSKYQTIYAQAKEIGIRLFKNTIDLTYYQLVLINWLSFYSVINLDIAMGDIDEVVLENEIYEDAYMYYRRNSKGDKKYSLPSSEEDKGIQKSTWVFKSPKKKV